VLLTSAVGWALPHLTGWGQALGLPRRQIAESDDVFLPTQSMVAGAVVVLSVWIAVWFDTWAQRLAGPLAVGLLFPAGGLLASLAERRVSRAWSRALRSATLALGVVMVAETSWGTLEAGPSVWLHRSVWLMMELAVMTVIYGVVLARLLPPGAWAETCRRSGPVLGVLASLMVLVVLMQEGVLYDPVAGRAPVATLAVLATAVALAILIGSALAFALWPGRDPLRLSEEGRTLYVYAAEGLLLLLGVHLRLTVPAIFQMIDMDYVPYVLMGLAYLVAAWSEIFRRAGPRVLVGPLQNTACLLGLAALATLQALPSRGHVQSAILWFVLAGLYVLLAGVRRSGRLALAAALAGTFGLWSLLLANRLGFPAHPQLWLIPLGLIALAAEQFRRDRPSAAHHLALRYLGLGLIYVPSLVELILHGLGASPERALALAVLSLLGMAMGAWLRVRAFLLAGVLFLMLDAVLMVWYVAVTLGAAWVGWLSGIVLGAAILTLFALFEKRRREMVLLIEALKKWH
jgi:hypothetical protein